MLFNRWCRIRDLKLFDVRGHHDRPHGIQGKPETEKVDVTTIERIKAEAEQHSQVMDVVSWITDVYGPRLTGSPNTKAAADWAIKRMQAWGLNTARLETWSPYDGGSGTCNGAH